ncbi:hypothetical protein [Chryseobacterium sediminis]|uniref:Uncharacterized protein n=1 Tax=Chryseobacterium sediminis TaxID=1679494 RepID=A0A5B2UDM6_9FLAO|nr:hypothetical protein [Chryseobacterium sediminis]KAA2224669.1 hypothetical protein FW780_10830 [Chryseobacterium sediminis]
MDIASTIPYGDSTRHNCDNCGAELEVHVVKQKSHNEKEEYNCPECNKLFYARVSQPIQKIIVIKKRTDGKTDLSVD